MRRRNYLGLGGAGLLLATALVWAGTHGKRSETGLRSASATPPEISRSSAQNESATKQSAVVSPPQKEAAGLNSNQLGHDAIACLRSTDVDERHRAFLELIAKMRPEDAAAVREAFWYYDKSGRRFDNEWGAFWRAWGKIDPLAALAASAKDKPSLAGDINGKILQSWGATDPAAAAKWLNENTSNPGYDEAFLGFVAGYATKDLPLATAAVVKTLQPDDALFGPSMQRLTTNATTQGGAAAVQDWFNSLIASTHGDPQIVAKASQSVTARMIGISLPDAAAFVGAQASQPWRSDAAIGAMSYSYSRADPTADAAWIASLPPANGAYVGMKELVGNWWQSDPAGFQQWLETQHGPVLDQAAKQFFKILGDKSPEITEHWKQRLGANPP